jgi:peptidoglycan-N-acetylglucosamine deacetylase
VKDQNASTRLRPIPERLVALTFDDACRSDIETVAPLLKQFGFGATFFVNDWLESSAAWKRENYLSWDQVRQLADEGFEIGNHTAHHVDASAIPPERLAAELGAVEEGCERHGIPRPISFCYPGFHFGRAAVAFLRQRGYRFARRGVSPEFKDGDNGGRGPAYDPRINDPLLIPTTGYSGPQWGSEDLAWTVEQARGGRAAVLCFHGVPDRDHAWVSTDPRNFETYLRYLADTGCSVIPMRGLSAFVDPDAPVNDPLASKERVPS